MSKNTFYSPPLYDYFFLNTIFVRSTTLRAHYHSDDSLFSVRDVQSKKKKSSTSNSMLSFLFQNKV